METRANSYLDSEVIEGKIKCGSELLQLHITFNCGQCYRWNHQPDGSWIGVFHHCVWTIKHEHNYLSYRMRGDYRKIPQYIHQNNKTLESYCRANQITHSLNDLDLINYAVWDYFRLFENVEEHYKRWSLCDTNFKEKATKFYGLRMLKQDPEEILFTFVCSSNTTISRITTMVGQLCSLYGEKICEIDGVVYYDFPAVSKLANPSVVQSLKEAKFGYRSEYVVNSATEIMRKGGREWFKKLNSMSYNEAKLEIMKLPGIGEKVADCICLMGLDHLNAIPVDTHVFKISKQYIPELVNIKTVNKKIYKRIGDYFRNLFGYHAGWAHVVLFCADLKMHQPTKSFSKVTKRTQKKLSRVVISKYFKSPQKIIQTD